MTDVPYLYMTSTGRVSGNPHQIEIWFVQHGGNYYLVNEHPDRSDWVKNIRKNPDVTIRVGSRDAEAIKATARPIDDRAVEAALAAAITRLMDAKYAWSDGLIVELKPHQ